MLLEITRITESAAEQATLDWFESLSYQIEPETNISPGGPNAERTPEEMNTAIRQLVARAGIRKDVKRLLRKYGYPPDKQEKAADTVLEQAETLCKDWTGEE